MLRKARSLQEKDLIEANAESQIGATFTQRGPEYAPMVKRKQQF